MLANAINALGRVLARHPLIVLALVLAAQTVFLFDSRALWFSDEVRYANAFENLLDGHWIVLYLNGEMYPDKPPLFFWLLRAVSEFFGGAAVATFHAGAAVTALGFVFAAYHLARRTGLLRGAALGAGLLLLGNFYVVGLAHYLRMDLMFAALIVAAQTLFYQGLTRERDYARMVGGFFLCGLAVLTKGPLGLALPLAALAAFALWSGRARRLFSLDVLLGLLVCAGLAGAWLGAAYMVEGQAYLDNIFYKQIYRRAVDTWHHEQPFYHYFATLPLVWLPWTLVVFCLPVGRVASFGFWREAWSARREAGGTAYLWTTLVSGLLLLSALSGKIVVYALPLFAPLAALSIRAVFGLEGSKRHRFWLLVAGYLALLGAALPFFELFNPWDISVPGLGLGTLALGATAAAVYKLRGATPAKPLAALVAGLTVALLPVGLISLPALDAAMSPKAQALAMKEYVQRGYAPAAHKIYNGIYTYYVGTNIYENRELENIAAFFETHDKAVVAFQEKRWKRWENKPKGAKVVQRQWIVDRPYVLVARDTSELPADKDPSAVNATAPAPAQNATAPAPSQTSATETDPTANATQPAPGNATEGGATGQEPTAINATGL